MTATLRHPATPIVIIRFYGARIHASLDNDCRLIFMVRILRLNKKFVQNGEPEKGRHYQSFDTYVRSCG